MTRSLLSQTGFRSRRALAPSPRPPSERTWPRKPRRRRLDVWVEIVASSLPSSGCGPKHPSHDLRFWVKCIHLLRMRACVPRLEAQSVAVAFKFPFSICGIWNYHENVVNLVPCPFHKMFSSLLCYVDLPFHGSLIFLKCVFSFAHHSKT